MKKMKRLCRVLAALLLAVCLVGAEMAPVLAVTQEEIDKLKNEAKDLGSQKKVLEAKLKELAGDKAKVLEQKKVLDQQIANTSAQIGNVEAQIADYASLITPTEEELADAEKREAAQYELFCQRVRAM